MPSGQFPGFCWPPSLCPTIPPLSLNSCILSFFNSNVRVFLAALPLLCVTCAHLQRQQLLKGKILSAILTVGMEETWRGWSVQIIQWNSDFLSPFLTLRDCGGQGFLNNTCSHLDSALSHCKKGKKGFSYTVQITSDGCERRLQNSSLFWYCKAKVSLTYVQRKKQQNTS